MGSRGKFDPCICLRCEREFVAVYPARWRCKQCTVLSIHQFVFYKVAERIGDTSLTFLLVPFMCFDYDRGARKRYLYIMALLAHGSLFRTFTWNGSEWLSGRPDNTGWYLRRAGNISDSEDIMDRICSFVCTKFAELHSRGSRSPQTPNREFPHVLKGLFTRHDIIDAIQHYYYHFRKTQVGLRVVEDPKKIIVLGNDEVWV